MFSRTNQGAPLKRAAGFSIIGPDVVITGDLVTNENLQVSGRIEGDVRCAGLQQDASGAITGNIVADEARLAGTVDGTLTARSVTLETTARVIGEVSYTVLSIESGARVDGKFAHREDAAEEGGRASLTEMYIDDEQVRAEAAE